MNHVFLPRSNRGAGTIALTAALILACLNLMPGCGGGASGNDADDIISAYNGRSIDLYREVPPICISGNLEAGQPRKFYPKGSTQSGFADTDDDGRLDTRINDFASFANAANNNFRAEIAACIPHGNTPRDLYADPNVWVDVNDRPDVMPRYADGSGSPSTNETQWFQVRFPFDLDPASIFDRTNIPNYLSPEIVLHDETGSVVPCSAFVNGRDATGTFHDPSDPLSLWPDGAVQAPDVIVFIANTPQDHPPLAVRPDIPEVPVAFTATDPSPEVWNNLEFTLHIGTVRDRKGRTVEIDSTHLIRRDTVPLDNDDTAVKVVDIVPSEYVLNPATGTPLQDHWPNISGGGEDLFVPPDASFQIIFNKPVVPETVGRSIVFNRAPFTGNMKTLPNPEVNGYPTDPACGPNIEPLATNIAVRAYFVAADGTTHGVETPIPLRVCPLSQNNMAKYIVNPLIDLPGSSCDWSGEVIDPGNPPPPLPPAGAIRMRIEVIVHEYMQNFLTGDPDGVGSRLPQNLCVGGFHGERFFNNGANYTKTFSVLVGQRYVNAPVSPNVIYYTMGTKGVGAIDLNGNGFTTNAPGTGRNMWVTSTSVYSPTGNGMLDPTTSNAYTYPVGLGDDTPIPGVNEGSSGWFNDLDPARDALVRDSVGSARLFPDRGESTAYSNITDLEVGDFLDTIYFDRSNAYNGSIHRRDMIYTSAPGNFMNNLISSPPTPNPPPLTLPVGMRPLDIILDDYSIHDEGAFVIMGQEVFPPDLTFIPLTGPKQWVHLDPAGLSAGADRPFPPNAPGRGPWATSNYIQNGPLAESCTFGAGYPFASRQQIGNFLFAADRGDNAIKVLNSNTMEEIASIEDGVRGPDQLALTPDLKTLYLSNGASRSVSVYNVNPRSADFLNLRTIIPVGSQPKGICCQPDYEDVLVCNYGSNSLSIINPATNTVRKTVTALVKKPWDVVAAPRQTTFGWGTGVYHAYIANHGGDNVLVFESGPDGLGGIGYDDILDPVPTTGENGQEFLEILNPRGICFNPLYLHNTSSVTNLTGGCFVAHWSTEGAAVSRIAFVDQFAPWGPIPITPISGSIGGTPGFGDRAFLITHQWTAGAGFLSGYGEAADVALPDFNREAWLNQSMTGTAYVTNWGAVGNNPSLSLPTNNKHPIRNLPSPTPTFYPDQLFVSYRNSSVIDVIDVNNGAVTTIGGLPGPAERIKTFFKN